MPQAMVAEANSIRSDMKDNAERARNDIGDLNDETFVRVDAITTTPKRKGRYPMSPATWWRWVKTKKAPQPVKLGPGITAWRLGDLRAWEAQQAGNGGA